MDCANPRLLSERLIVAVIGPTAAGKTALALALAEATGAEIIGCDALQVRAGLPILTAKPTAEELRRAPHHLIGAWPIDEPATAAQYASRADAVIAGLHTRGTPVIVCGGTGLYLDALCHGLFEAPRADPELRQRLRAEADALGVPALHSRLALVDPAAAQRIAPADYVRIERALEIFELTGRPISDWQAESRRERDRGPRHRMLFVGISPGADELRTRIAARATAMVEAGLLDEVRDALAAHGPLRHPPLGFDLAQRHLDGELTREAMLTMLSQKTAQFARRQRTWFRHVAGVRWFPDVASVPLAELVAALRLSRA